VPKDGLIKQQQALKKQPRFSKACAHTFETNAAASPLLLFFNSMNKGAALSAGAAALPPPASPTHGMKRVARRACDGPAVPAGSELHMTPATTSYTALLRRRAQTYPLQYLLAEIEFSSCCSRDNPSVIPRPETKSRLHTRWHGWHAIRARGACGSWHGQRLSGDCVAHACHARAVGHVT
jgi:hypothetical protein